MTITKVVLGAFPLLTLAGCLATGGQKLGDPYLQQGNLEQAIRQYENERPGLKKLCVALDAGFSPAKGQLSISKKSYAFEEIQARWDHLFRLGLFSKHTDRTSVTYKLTSSGRAAYNDGKCSKSVERYSGDFTGPALVYANLEFNRLEKTQKNPYHQVASTSFTKRLFSVTPWGEDKEFRRAWQLQGLEEIERLRWFVSYKTSSNGIEFTEPPQLFVLQN